jgi:creatinine amidohydrolase/Fe(II)-dependent formamide hydrolase-like protein
VINDSRDLSRRRFLQCAGTGAAAALPAATLAQAAAKAPGAGSKRKHRYEELLPEEFYEEFRRAPIIYVGFGPLEEHGLQNALGTDLFSAYEICSRAVEISGGILFPPVPFAIAGRLPGLSREDLRSGKKELFPPSFWVSGELCRRIYVELLESAADLGFKACIAFGGHGPAGSMLMDIHKEMGGRVRGMPFWGGNKGSILEDVLKAETKKNPNIAGHGMMWETSGVMAMHPEWVDLPRARRIRESPLPSQLKNQPQARLDCIATANAEFGNRLYNLAAERLAKIAREMLDQPK